MRAGAERVRAMSRLATATLAAGFLATSLSANSLAQSNSRRVDLPPAANEIAESAAAYQSQNRVIGQYCVRCHNDANRTADLSLESFDVARAHESAEIVEKMIRKLQAGMMPPPPLRRPDRATVNALVTSLAGRIDEAAAAGSYGGGRTFQRLNRAEYERSVRQLLDLEIDAAAYLPPDTISEGFDNVADVQGLSVTVMQGFLAAAGEVSRMALGNVRATPSATTYSVPRFASQRQQVEGAPYGTRGGLSVIHHFPADAEYTFTMDFYDSPIAELFGKRTLHDEQIEISINGEPGGAGRHRSVDECRQRSPRGRCSDFCQGGTTARIGRVSAALRGACRRHALTARVEPGRQEDRQLVRGDFVTAFAGPDHRRALQPAGRIGNAEPRPYL